MVRGGGGDVGAGEVRWRLRIGRGGGDTEVAACDWPK